MTLLQYVFLIALSGSLLAVTLFTAATVRSTLQRRGGALAGSWIERLGTATRPDDQMWAFIAHRVTGVAIFAFLAVHIADVFAYAISRSAFDEIHRLYGTAPMRIFECLLLFAILFHTLNGVRLLILDVSGIGESGSRWMLRVAVIVAATIGSSASLVILSPMWS
ncbi:MAG: succinate dehydrogenase, cytochrome b556 subunit [Myxococcales bacterium]|nr:succinate dehydrogenase, cytochrome b556 subunit [Myxococcales bacterium]MDH5281989.1 succinate dehydrogenase, cytochrome b556 subunit [Thermoleophilia bacterium]